jgi:hypothetical protein
VTNRKTDAESVSNESLARARDEIALAWEREYQNPESPYYQIPGVR